MPPASSNPVAGIDVVARLDQFKRDMAAVPGIGEEAARQMATKLSQEIKAAERAAKQAGEAAKKGKKDFGDLGDVAGRAAASLEGMEKAAGKTGERLSKVRGLVSTLNPELGELVGGGADVADVFEVAGGLSAGFLEVLGRMVPVAAAAGAALVTMTAVVDDYSAAKKEALRREQAFVMALQPLDEALASARAEHDLLTQAQNAGKDAMKEYAEIADLHAAVDTKVAESTAALRDEAAKLIKARADGTRESRSEQIQNDARLRQISAEISALEKKGDELKSLKESSRSLREALDDETEGEKKNTGAVTENGETKLSFDEQVAAMRERLAARETTRRQELYASESADALEGAAILAKVEEDQTKKVEEELKKRLEAQKAAAEEAVRIQHAEAEAVSNILGAVGDLAGNIAGNMTEEQKQAALSLFAVQKAAAAAQAGINTVLAISEASTLPYPANIPAMIAAGVQGAANEAAILSAPPPVFNDTPQVMQMGTRGNVSLGAGDYFAAARDPAELQRQVLGMDPHADYRDGGPTVAIVGARAFGRRVRDDLRLRTPLQRAIFAGRATGQRSR